MGTSSRKSCCLGPFDLVLDHALHFHHCHRPRQHSATISGQSSKTHPPGSQFNPHSRPSTALPIRSLLKFINNELSSVSFFSSSHYNSLCSSILRSTLDAFDVPENRKCNVATILARHHSLPLQRRIQPLKRMVMYLRPIQILSMPASYLFSQLTPISSCADPFFFPFFYFPLPQSLSKLYRLPHLFSQKDNNATTC